MTTAYDRLVRWRDAWSGEPVRFLPTGTRISDFGADVVALLAERDELLAVCKATLEFYDTVPNRHVRGEASILDDLQNAINNAEGRTP